MSEKHNVFEEQQGDKCYSSRESYERGNGEPARVPGRPFPEFYLFSEQNRSC